MDDDKYELEQLEALYKEVASKRMNLTSKENDDAILQRAQDHINASVNPKVVSMNQYRKGKAIWSGFSIAAGLLLGLSIKIPDGKIAAPLPSFDHTLTYMGESNIPLPVDIDNLNAEEMQLVIAELVMSGEISRAQKLIAIFSEKFPHFEDN
jgi:hypothetical protein